MEWKSRSQNGTTEPSDPSQSRVADNNTSEVDTPVMVRKTPPSPPDHSRWERNRMEEEASGEDRKLDQPLRHTALIAFHNLPSEDVDDRPSSPNSSFDRSLMEIPPCMIETYSTESGIIDILQSHVSEPPVTTATLKELDLSSIQNNLNLRIDVCHDQELFFQPISGRKGDAKKSEARTYWLALTIEFLIYLHNSQSGCSRCEHINRRKPVLFQPRLSVMFDHLREIVQMLVPESDQEEVANHLDTELLMQQVHVGALDAGNIAIWLSKLLTLHCAPMRDNSAAEVTEQIQTSTEIADMDSLVGGLEKLFGLLEAMKLDVANHQIRAFRTDLIGNTVTFQQNCFATAIEARQINVVKSQRWYMQECANHHRDCTSGLPEYTTTEFASFVHGLTRLCDPSETNIPLTLQYDQNRFLRLREDLQDHIHLSLCLAVFNNQVSEVVGMKCDPTPMHDDLKKRIICLTEDDDGNGGAISDHLDAIGMEIARAAFSMRPKSQTSTRSYSNLDFNQTIKLLHDVFQNEDREQCVTKSFLTALERRTMDFARTFRSMSPLEISNAQKHWSQGRIGKENLLADWDGMARKLAHIGVVHWRVWEHLCYLSDSVHQGTVKPVLTRSPDSSTQSELEAGLEPPRAVSLQRSQEFRMEVDNSMAFGEGMACTKELDTRIERHDSGFSEIETQECITTFDPEAEIDRKRRDSRSKVKRLSDSR